MKTRRLPLPHELDSAPQGEWFYDPEGRELEIIDDAGDGKRTLRIPIPKATAARLGLRAGERLTAKYSRGVLTVMRPRRRIVRRKV